MLAVNPIIVTAVSQQPPSMNSRTRSDNRSGDQDCSDFRSWSEAQSFYENSGAGDPHRLDTNSDGIACEKLQ